MRDLSALERDIMYLLAGSSGLKGYEIREQLKEYYDKPVYDGSIYPAIETLTEEGLVLREELNGRTNQYQLTARGQDEMRFRRRWENESNEKM